LAKHAAQQKTFVIRRKDDTNCKVGIAPVQSNVAAEAPPPFALSAEQSRLFGEALDLLAAKTAQDETAVGVEFPHVTEPDGSWRTWRASISAGYSGTAWSHGNWTCGFWVGLLVAAYHRTGQQRYLDWAEERMRLVAPRCADGNTHDIGFIFYGSAIPLHHATGAAWWAELALAAADRLRARLIPTRTGAYLSSWGPLSDERGRASSAIDTMANLSLLYWAARHAGDGSFRFAAEAHARKTWDAFVRPDHSTYHAVEYDTQSGERRRGYTFQGHADESLWSRGQGWAIYGLVETARETGDLEYLHRAERLAKTYIDRLGGAQVPPWDFDDPDPGRVYDSAAAAIVASALIDLGALHPDAGAGRRWSGHALAMMEALCRDFLAREPQHRGMLKHGCYSMPHRDGMDSATMFGDFYFIEALSKLAMPGRFVPEARWRVPPVATGS
jgi:unsaturated chondroitin disaccharide hydrolase